MTKTDQVRALREARQVRREKPEPPKRELIRPASAPGPGRPKRKGPPPWEALGLSQRTYYRRLAAKKAAK